MNDVLGIPLPLFLVVQVPLLLIWVLVVWDIAQQPSMPLPRKVAWVLACSLVVPAQIVYLLVRPQRGRAEWSPQPRDPHARLVAAALDHEAGRLDDASFAATVAALRGGTEPPPSR